MRLLVLVLFTFSLLSITNAQSFLPATLITRQGDTLPGYVRADYSPLFIRFKSGPANLPVNYEISSVNGLIVAGLVYERRIIDNENILMQKLVSGEASLFVVRRRAFQQNRYFLEKGTTFVELVRKSSETVLNGQLYAETYQNHLALFTKFLNDCNEFNNQRWPTGFNEEAFITLITNYNQCVHKNNQDTPKNTLYRTPTAVQTQWFINAGGGLLASYPYDTKSILSYYRSYADDNRVGFVELINDHSKWTTNRFFSAAIGFERFRTTKHTSWGGSLGYTNMVYTYDLDAQLAINYVPTPLPFVGLSGEIREFPPPSSNQPVTFKGESQEKSSIIQADVFVRNYWMRDKGKIYLGIGAGGGFISSTFIAPVSVYYSDGSYQGKSVRNTQLSSNPQVKVDIMVQAGWAYLLNQRGQSAGFSIQYNSLQSNRVALLLTYSF